MAQTTTLTKWIKTKAKLAGFEACHITKAELPPLVAKRLKEFVDAAYHGEMGWLADSQDMRASTKASLVIFLSMQEAEIIMR